MTRRVVLFGATGYTGRRVAEEMVARGMVPVLAGRDPGKLASLAARLGGLPTAPAELGSVHTVVGAGDVLVSTVGPFLRFGQAALTAAVRSGAIYLDSSGEPPFIRRVFEESGPWARRTGASLLTAFGNDYVPGNLAGALALSRAGDAATRIEVGYFVTGVGRAQAFSRGTLVSLLGLAGQPGFTWRDGIRTEPSGVRMRTFRVAGRDRPAMTVGASEHFALPRLAPGLREVDVYLGWFGPATRPIHLASRAAAALRLPGSRGRPGSRGGPGAGGLLSLVASPLLSRVSEEPDAAALRRITSHFVAVASDARGAPLAEARLTAGDPYLLTAKLLAWGAHRAAEHGVDSPGALGPVDVFGLDTLTAAAPDLGLHHP